MRLMRKSAVRLITLLYVVSIALLQPIQAGESLNAQILSERLHSHTASTPVTCYCARCHAAGGTKAVCPCCQGRACTCRLSSDEDDTSFLLQDNSAMLNEPVGLRVPVLCTALISETSYFTHGRDLSPPVPPPRIRNNLGFAQE